MKNKRPFVIGLIIITLLIIGGVVWSMQSSNQETSTETTTPATPATSEAEAVTINVEAGNFYFNPKEIKVKKGAKVTIVLSAKGMTHDFVLDEFNFEVPATSPGQTNTASFTADKTGSFEYYCSIGNHRRMGQVGTLIVE